VAPLTAQVPSRESDELFARGVRQQQAGDLPGARGAYEAALRFSPRRIDALSNLGLVYGGLRQYDRAIQTLERARDVDPKQPAVLFNLGLAYLQAGQNENARRTLASLTGSPASPYLARHYLGVSLLKLNRIEAGILELEAVTSDHPEDLEAFYTLASAYITSKRLDKARRIVDTVVSRQDTAEAHLITGSFWMAAQDYREAVVELRRAQELNPALPELGASLGGAYAMTGSREMAMQLFEEHLRTHASDFDTLAFLGWLYLESDRVDDAAKALMKAREIRPADLEVMFQLARIARAREQYQEAAGLLQSVVTAKPDHVRAHVLLAQTYFKLKKTVEGNREREIVRRLNAQEESRRQKETGLSTPAPQ